MQYIYIYIYISACNRSSAMLTSCMDISTAGLFISLKYREQWASYMTSLPALTALFVFQIQLVNKVKGNNFNYVSLMFPLLSVWGRYRLLCCYVCEAVTGCYVVMSVRPLPFLGNKMYRYGRSEVTSHTKICVYYTFLILS